MLGLTPPPVTKEHIHLGLLKQLQVALVGYVLHGAQDRSWGMHGLVAGGGQAAPGRTAPQRPLLPELWPLRVW